MRFFLASHNKGKRDEVARILAPLGVELVIPEDIDKPYIPPEETGTTFAENAMIKARHGCEWSGLPAIADDSGLCVDALGGAPGVHTARYGGEDLPYHEKMSLLVSELRDVPPEKRGAAYVCSIACVFPDGRTVTAEGTCRGVIGYGESGDGGFGFDPIFYVGGVSMASLTDAQKDAISHRGAALAKFAERLSEASQ